MKRYFLRLWCVSLFACAMASFFAFAAVAQSPSALSTPPDALASLSQDELNAFGARLANEAYTIMSQVGADGKKPEKAINNAKALFDRDALIQNSRLNYGLTRSTFIPTSIPAFTLSNVVLNRAAPDVLVTSFDVRMPNRTGLDSSVMMSGEAQPRLVVLRWNTEKKRWLVMSSADFDTPKGAICGAPPVRAERKSQFKTEDIQLAKANLDRFLDSSLNGTEKNFQAKGFTYVLADGQRKTQDSGIRTRVHKKTPVFNVEAIRSGSLLMMRFDANSAAIIDGSPLHNDLKPRLMTMIKGDDGQWRMLAIGMFSVTADLAAMTECVKPATR